MFFTYTKNLSIIIDLAMAQSATYNLDFYQPRNPKASAYYRWMFLTDGSFRTALGFILEDREKNIQYEVLKMLKKKAK